MRRTLKAARVLAAAALLAFAAHAARAQGVITVEGKLARTTEAGGWLITNEAGKYLILNARRFQGEAWFKEGAAVVATGEVKNDTMTTYMEGAPFEARTLRPRRGGAPSPNGDAATSDGDTGSSSNNTQGGKAVAGLMRGTTRVVATGDSTVKAYPDTAIVTVSVASQNTTASETQTENASKSDAVVRAVKAVAGAGAEVTTSGYLLTQQYSRKEGAPQAITSYIARNAINVTTSDLSRVGAILDAATRAGAFNIDSISFTLRRGETARAKALSDATREATAKARTIAEALGGRVVRVVEVQETGTTVNPVINPSSGEAYGRKIDTTPIEPGSLDVRAQVTLVAEVEPKP